MVIKYKVKLVLWIITGHNNNYYVLVMSMWQEIYLAIVCLSFMQNIMKINCISFLDLNAKAAQHNQHRLLSWCCEVLKLLPLLVQLGIYSGQTLVSIGTWRVNPLWIYQKSCAQLFMAHRTLLIVLHCKANWPMM